MNKTITLKNPSTTNEKNETIDNPKKLTEEPSQQVINNILNYSKALSITPSKNMVYLKVVLN